MSAYIISGNERRQLLDLDRLIVVALLAQQHLTIDPLQRLGCVRCRNATRNSMVEVL